MKKIPPTILCVGKSHSGKTTVARSLAEHIDFTVLDTDAIDLFVKDNYPGIVDFEKNNREFYSNKDAFTPLLKLEVQATVFRYSLKIGKGVILSNGNLTEAVRSYQVAIAKKAQSPTVIVLFDIRDEVLLQRIKTSGKTTKTLTVSKSLEEMLERQISVFVPPHQGEADYMLTINAEAPIEENVDRIVAFLKSHKLVR